MRGLVTEDICDRGTRIQGTKGELIGDMKTFVSPSASRRDVSDATSPPLSYHITVSPTTFALHQLHSQYSPS
jgi:hypothetical protein